MFDEVKACSIHDATGENHLFYVAITCQCDLLNCGSLWESTTQQSTLNAQQRNLNEAKAYLRMCILYKDQLVEFIILYPSIRW